MKRNIIIRSDLILRNPYEVYTAITQNENIKKWHKFISEYYLPPPGKKILLFYPCSKTKPYTEARSYKLLFKNLANLGEKRKLIHILTVSEPFALVPEEFFNRKTKWYDWENGWYDCPGLFKWWCKKVSETYDEYYAQLCIDLLANVIRDFLNRLSLAYVGNNFKCIGFVRTMSSSLRVTSDHTHRKILEKAAANSKIKIELLPPRSFIRSLVRKKGQAAWDFYGVSHPLSQRYLIKKISHYLNAVIELK
jgi:archaeosine synthase